MDDDNNLRIIEFSMIEKESPRIGLESKVHEF